MYYIVMYDINYVVTVMNPLEFLESINWTATDNIVDNGDDRWCYNESRCRAITDAVMRLDW